MSCADLLERFYQSPDSDYLTFSSKANAITVALLLDQAIRNLNFGKKIEFELLSGEGIVFYHGFFGVDTSIFIQDNEINIKNEKFSRKPISPSNRSQLKKCIREELMRLTNRI